MALTLRHSCEYTQIQVTYCVFLVKTRQDDSYNMNSEIELETLYCNQQTKVFC